MLVAGLTASATPASHYATSSALASGKWVKVRIDRTGMQFISNSSLKNMGFTDPAAVNVYGFGGREIPRTLGPDTPDDLPVLPVVRTSAGIYFFGYDYIRWDYKPTVTGKKFSHAMNHFSEESWYFLSDSERPPFELQPADAPDAPALPEVTSFTQPLLHEQDLVHPSSSGPTYLGEDFRSPSRHSFDFNLTDITGGDALLDVKFAANYSSGSASLMISADGNRLPSTPADIIPAVTGSDAYMSMITTRKTITTPGPTLKIDLEFQNSGTLRMARLDYMEIEYTRRLALHDGQLHFNSILDAPSRLKIEGCKEGTVIWDITDPVTPREVKYTLDGTTAYFGADTGYHEFIALNPGEGGYAITSGTRVGNQDIHSLEIPDMVIITPQAFADASLRLARHHEEVDGLKVHVLTPEAVYNEFSSGSPDVSAFRKLLKMWHDRGEDPSASESRRIRYCLLMTRPTYDNKLKMETPRRPGIKYIPILQLDEDGYDKNTSFSADDFIGMLDDCSDNFSIGSAKIHVAVGRFPVVSASEADQMVDKYISYVNDSNLGSWRNQMMLIADDGDSAEHLKQSETCYANIQASADGPDFRIERLYLDAYPLEAGSTGNTYPQAKERMLRLWNDGVAFINYIGHASTAGWSHEDLLNWTDITTGFRNRNLPVLYAATCEFGRWDQDERGGCEVLWFKPEAGIISAIVPSRTVYISNNGRLSDYVSSELLKCDDLGNAPRIGDIIRNAKNRYPGSDKNKLRFVTMGNPAQRFPIPALKINALTINGETIGESDNLPVLKARGTAVLTGNITDADGNPVTDFNGNLEILLYDAEKVITTNGNGDKGIQMLYNDRKTLLYRGSAKITDGNWQVTVLLPSEIENNYSPGKFFFYASNEEHLEAHGNTDDFFIYGYDENAPLDETGPEITLFALNRKDFTDGSVVHSSPVVLARFSDESGINISDAGIGHAIMLTLDGKTYFDDASSYFTPDPEDYRAGSLQYPVSDIATGSHTLTLTVWDNANNSSSAELHFEVAAAKAPAIYELYTDANPARDKVNFTLSTDRPMADVECLIEVFDLNGRCVWSFDTSARTDIDASMKIPWNLRDAGGTRVPRGIYLYRATVTSPEGPSATSTRKLAVAAP